MLGADTRLDGQSKTANIYMATQIDRLYGSQGLHGYSLSPGSFVSPNLQKHCQDEMKAAKADARLAKYLASVEQGCATSVYGAVSRELEGKGGLYLEGACVAGPVPPGSDQIEYGYGEWAFDREKEEKLWELIRDLAGRVASGTGGTEVEIALELAKHSPGRTPSTGRDVRSAESTIQCAQAAGCGTGNSKLAKLLYARELRAAIGAACFRTPGIVGTGLAADLGFSDRALVYYPEGARRPGPGPGARAEGLGPDRELEKWME
ncbi:hypothetical protein DL768_009823 [Monosporascus sp. mg162]|nr:hypothetical protein DL768_009823 [Monosporascus sp. mg162]